MGRRFPFGLSTETRVMVFVDGENLAIRFPHALGDMSPQNHIVHHKDVYVWSTFVHQLPVHTRQIQIVRKYYYTALRAADPELQIVEDELKAVGIEAPRVFKKVKDRSKRVDISLATDMLTHAHRKNYNVTVLVAGDEDYVPLVDAVMSEGRRVVLWFYESGLSSVLRRRVDHYFDIAEILFTSRDELSSKIPLDQM